MSININLQYPITVAGEEVTELTLQRLKVKDIKAAKSKTDEETTIKLLAISAGLTPKEMDELDLLDFTTLSEALTDFLFPTVKK